MSGHALGSSSCVNLAQKLQVGCSAFAESCLAAGMGATGLETASTWPSSWLDGLGPGQVGLMSCSKQPPGPATTSPHPRAPNGFTPHCALPWHAGGV